ncbi:unnamed protein product [Lathyrus oleraceus]
MCLTWNLNSTYNTITHDNHIVSYKQVRYRQVRKRCSNHVNFQALPSAKRFRCCAESDRIETVFVVVSEDEETPQLEIVSGISKILLKLSTEASRNRRRCWTCKFFNKL